MPDTAPLAESLLRALNMAEGRSVDYVPPPPAPTSETHGGSCSQVDQQFDAVGFHFPRPTRCDTATCKPGTDPWRRSFYSHPSTTWPSRTPARVMSALAAMACVGRRAQLDVLDVVRAKRSRTPRTTASRRRLPSPGGPWARLGGTQLARREGARCPDVGKLMRMLLPKGSLRSCRMAGRRELATRGLFRVHGQGRRYFRCVRTWREIMTTLDQFRLTTVSLERYFNDTFLGQGTGLYGRSRN